MKKLDVSVVICTLNAAKSLETCFKSIKKNNPKEIIVMDGGSRDNSVEIAKKNGAKVIIKKDTGVAYRRQVGADNATGKYVAYIDSDDRLDPTCFETLISELEKNKYDGIQAFSLGENPVTYWQKAMNLNAEYFTSVPGKTDMMGRPTLLKKSVFKKVHFDPTFFFGGEDADFSIQMELNGLSQGIGTGLSRRTHSATFRENARKWFLYGVGDARLIYKYKNRTKRILYHLIVNYPIKKSWVLVKNGQFKYIPFFVLQGWIRLLGVICEYPKLLEK